MPHTVQTSSDGGCHSYAKLPIHFTLSPIRLFPASRACRARFLCAPNSICDAVGWCRSMAFDGAIGTLPVPRCSSTVPLDGAVRCTFDAVRLPHFEEHDFDAQLQRSLS